MNEVCEFLKKCGTYYLATVEGNQPRVRPFGTIDLFEGKLYIQTGKSKAVSAQVKENPNIEITGMTGGKWIRVAAEAVLDESIEAQAHMLDAHPSSDAVSFLGRPRRFIFPNGLACAAERRESLSTWV